MGYSGHGRVLLDAVKSLDLKVEGYFQDTANHENPFSLKYMGNESDCTDDFFPKSKFIIGIGDNLIRSKVFQFIKNKKGNIETVFHSTASISNLAEINVNVEIGQCIRFKMIESEFSNAEIVDDCCCVQYP